MKIKTFFLAIICLLSHFHIHADLLNFTVKDINGEKLQLERSFLGKVLLIVNTASRCGATDQYADLQQLHETYSKEGLVVIAVPTNDFGAQEPGTNQEIAKFCQKNYGVTFPILSKTTFEGANANPFIKKLTNSHPEAKRNKSIGWNFEKFIIDRNGQLIERFSTSTEPSSSKITSLIDKLLKEEPRGVQEYLGRLAATTMHWKGAPWLIRKRREAEESTEQMIQALNIKADQTLCDLGAGNGYHTLKMATLTGKKGVVYAVDIQPEMLEMLKKRASENKITNIKTIKNKFYDTGLPTNSIDKMLLCDVYHEFSHPKHMLNDIFRSLKQDGELVLVEFRTEDKTVPIKPDHKMSHKQIVKELEANGFSLSKSYDALPWQHMLFFKKKPL